MGNAQHNINIMNQPLLPTRPLENQYDNQSPEDGSWLKTTNHLKTGAGPTPQMSCVSNTSQSMDEVGHNISKIN
jgi:hypothetical protein